MQLLLAEIGVLDTQLLELRDNPFIPEALAFGTGDPAPKIQGFDLSVSFFELPLPVKERALFDLESIEGCPQSVLAPEHENLVPTLG